MPVPAVQAMTKQKHIPTMSTIERVRIAKQIKLLLDNGFRAAHLFRARYPSQMVQLMMHIERTKTAMLSPEATCELAPYNTVQYYTSTSPHVLCPTCNKACVLRKDKRLRKHSCIRMGAPRATGVPMGVVAAPPILATVVRPNL